MHPSIWTHLKISASSLLNVFRGLLVRLTLAIAGMWVVIAGLAQAETLVVAVPQTEFPALASQMVDGAKAALNSTWNIKIIDAGCNAENSAVNLILAEKPDAVIGLPCIESLSPVLQALGPLGVPIITIASRADAPSKLAAKNKWLLYRIGPREHQEGEAVAQLIVEAWRDKPFAILDDGTIFARDTAESIRNAAETLGIKPVLVDGFQPQLENQKKLIDRLLASGATHVFIASDRGNIAQIANEAAGKLTIAGPETLRANDLDFPLPSGVLMAARENSLNDDAMQKIKASRDTAFAEAEGYTLDAFVGAEIAMDLKASQTSRTFQTAAGQMTIANDGFVEPVSFALFRFDGATFQKVSP
jgi:branched-chain amino acid transport system substrate-binding protein